MQKRGKSSYERAENTEYILLGILNNEDGTAVKMLARLGVSPEALEERLFEVCGRADG